MKKILFMVTSMNIGGVEKSLLSLLACIPKDKYEITLLLLDKSGGFLEHIPCHINIEEANWFEIVKPIIMDSPHNVLKNYIKKRQYMNSIRFVISYVIDKYFDNRYIFYRNAMKIVPKNNNKYDVVICYQGPTDIIDYYISNKINSDKKISWVHFDVSKHSFNTKLYKKLYGKYNKIFVVSEQGKDRLIEKIPEIKEKTDVFLNIISKDLIKDMAKDNIEFDNNYKGIKIVTVGRLSKEKGQDLAIKALKMLKEDGYDVRWYCVGDGNSRLYYEDLIKKYNLGYDFILLGAKTNPYPYIKNADIYVQTSRHEGYCLTLAEAKYLAKPIVTTNFIGAYEQIQDGKNGFICDCRVEELYKKIKYLIDNKNIKNTFYTNLVNEDISMLTEVDKLFEIID